MGTDVVVAVVDSGVGADAAIDVVERPVVVPGLEREHYHGTAVAGLVAGLPRALEDGGGLVGVAPAAQVLDLQVYDDPTGQTGTPILTDNVVQGARRRARPGAGRDERAGRDHRPQRRARTRRCRTGSTGSGRPVS